MMNNTNEVNMLHIAAAEAGLRASEIDAYRLTETDGLCEVSFHTAWMRYDCFVDACGQVLGFAAEPACAA